MGRKVGFGNMCYESAQQLFVFVDFFHFRSGPQHALLIDLFDFCCD